MKKLILILFLLVSVNVYGQNRGKVYIIPDSIPPLGLFYWLPDRFTPTMSDIARADSIILANKEKIKEFPGYYSGMKRGIFRNYRKYIRQYVGFIDKNGSRIILINYVGNKQIIKEVKNKNDLIIVLDGGNRFWQAVVNLDEKLLIDVAINGEA